MADLNLPSPDLRRFPRRTLRSSKEVFRVHPSGVGPWWFSSAALGRFDLEPPSGTCYLSLSPLGAFVEVFRDFAFVAAQDVAERSLSRLCLPADVVLADCTSARARAFGVTAAIHSTADYETTRAWAVAFRERGLNGVRYFCGHDPSQREVAVALFGAAGDAEWPTVATTGVPDEVIRAAGRRFGVLVVPTP